MGAEFWEHQTTYEPDAASALHRLQAALYRASGCALDKLLNDRIRNAIESVRLCEENDPYDLLEHYRGCLRDLRRLATRGIPDEPKAQIALLRKIEAIGSDSAPGLLAIEGVSRRWAERKVHCLTARRMNEIFGTATPSLREAREVVGRLADNIIQRGSGICFPVYEDGQPALWYFAGFTAD
jgi:hypothetical protein